MLCIWIVVCYTLTLIMSLFNPLYVYSYTRSLTAFYYVLTILLLCIDLSDLS
jgi:hypothetical protein